MTDINPYGTIRIFSPSQQVLDKIYSAIKQLEIDANYQHLNLATAFVKRLKLKA